MSLSSLEKFNKQFERGEPRTVCGILAEERAGRFAFYIPSSDKPDTAALIEQVGGCLPKLAEVVRDPYIVLKSEYEQVRTEIASSLTPQGIQQTVKEPKLWKRQKDGRLRPEFVYAKTNEDEYNTYENRVIRSLIDKILRFLKLPFDHAKDGVKNLYEAYFQSASLNKLDLIKLMDSDLFRESDPQDFADYSRLYYLRARTNQLRSSDFYKIMSAYPPFAGRPEATNLFVHNQNYNACYKLWLFLDEFGAGLSALSKEERASVYSAFVSIAMIAVYVRMGFRVVRDATVARIDEGFSLRGFSLENDTFRVFLDADPEKISVLVKCSAAKAQQNTVIRLHTDIAAPYPGDCQFVVSLYRTDYSDRIACVVPGNKNSLRDLESIVRCTVFELAAEKSIYSKVCLVCGSNMLEDKGYFYKCEECGAVYSFIGEDRVWLNQFNVLSRNGDEQ